MESDPWAKDISRFRRSRLVVTGPGRRQEEAATERSWTNLRHRTATGNRETVPKCPAVRRGPASHASDDASPAAPSAPRSKRAEPRSGRAPTSRPPAAAGAAAASGAALAPMSVRKVESGWTRNRCDGSFVGTTVRQMGVGMQRSARIEAGGEARVRASVDVRLYAPGGERFATSTAPQAFRPVAARSVS